MHEKRYKKLQWWSRQGNTGKTIKVLNNIEWYIEGYTCRSIPSYLKALKKTEYRAWLSVFFFYLFFCLVLNAIFFICSSTFTNGEILFFIYFSKYDWPICLSVRLTINNKSRCFRNTILTIALTCKQINPQIRAFTQ